uniref:AAA+ ATPase domain-containing protein n=1 Tax=Parascaris univalens TaxID=6257 RepID=A0A915C4K5_PARUN
MSLSLSSGGVMQALSSQVLSLRTPSLHSGTVRKYRRTDTPADIFTLRAYQRSFSGIAKEDLNAVLKEFHICPPYRLLRARILTYKLNESISVSYHPTTAQFYIQQRGFRTRAGPKGIATKKTIKEEKSFLSRFFPDFRAAKNVEGLDRSDVDRWNVYENELKKIPEPQRKTFTEGFVKGILSMKNNETSTPVKKPSAMSRFFVFLTLAIFIAFWSGTIRVRLGDRQLGSLIFSSPQEVKPEDVTVTFDDVRGMDEAKKEVEEIVSYLRDPDRYSRLGGRLPKGVLLVGPPGTGKTLLARAIAGEAQVPFFHTSGSEFDEVLVGQGARRVRDLFERAKQRAPCIIFIDEIDSVGSKRVSNSIHPYANQTINQLLAEMDGFNRNEGVIIIGATNRVEDLDKALLRPGRFDVRVTVSPPDLLGRKDILRHYLSKIIHTDEVNVDTLAKGTTGFTGADIENMINQAALKAASDGCPMVLMSHFEDARDRVLMGPARLRGRLPDEEANRITAYHEAGHTLVGLFTKDSIPLHKVTIIPRGQSLGHTAIMPEKDEYHMTKSQMLAQLDMMMGGRVAEELIFGTEKVTTGAADDLRKATQLATKMVKTFGMSDRVGLRDFSPDDNNTFIMVNDLSPQMAELIDQEISRLLTDSYGRAKEILTKHKKEHKLLAEALLEYETLASEEVKELFENGKISRRSPQQTQNILKRSVARPPSHVVHIHLDQSTNTEHPSGS